VLCWLLCQQKRPRGRQGEYGRVPQSETGHRGNPVSSFAPRVILYSSGHAINCAHPREPTTPVSHEKVHAHISPAQHTIVLRALIPLKLALPPPPGTATSTSFLGYASRPWTLWATTYAWASSGDFSRHRMTMRCRSWSSREGVRPSAPGQTQGARGGSHRRRSPRRWVWGKSSRAPSCCKLLSVPPVCVQSRGAQKAQSLLSPSLPLVALIGRSMSS